MRNLLLRARITFLSAEGSRLVKSLVYVHSPKRRLFRVPEVLASHLESSSCGTKESRRQLEATPPRSSLRGGQARAMRPLGGNYRKLLVLTRFIAYW